MLVEIERRRRMTEIKKDEGDGAFIKCWLDIGL
jgi:hypothetical protein